MRALNQTNVQNEGDPLAGAIEGLLKEPKEPINVEKNINLSVECS